MPRTSHLKIPSVARGGIPGEASPRARRPVLTVLCIILYFVLCVCSLNVAEVTAKATIAVDAGAELVHVRLGHRGLQKC